MPVDPRAVAGFGGDVAAYELGRPEYPPAAIALLASAFALTEASTVVDLAAGTGKLTRALVGVAGDVVAVEPSEAMLATLTRVVPGARGVRGTAEAIPLPSASADLVTVAEAFHWFTAEDAAREIARVLRPGGGLAALWNRAMRTHADPGWLMGIRELVQPHLDAAGPFPADRDLWRAGVDASGLFEPFELAAFEQVDELTPQRLEALVASWSWIAALPGATREPLLAEVRALVSREPRLEVRYRTEVHTTRRRPAGEAAGEPVQDTGP